MLRGTSAKLQGVPLRSAKLQDANLVHADLQGANLGSAKLQGADLRSAKLQDANLVDADLQGANLGDAKLWGANLGGAELQGARLPGAELEGADLDSAKLQGANLYYATLRGANLHFAELRGANLHFAKLQGADLDSAKLQGAVLQRANLYGAKGNPAGGLVDVREILMEPMSDNKVKNLASHMESKLPSSMSGDLKEKVMVSIKNLGGLTASTIHFDSCLSDAEDPVRGLECDKRFNASENKELRAFVTELHLMLTDLACESTEIAKSLTEQANWEGQLTRQRLEKQFVKKISDESCLGLWGLSPEKKKLIWDAAAKSK